MLSQSRGPSRMLSDCTMTVVVLGSVWTAAMPNKPVHFRFAINRPDTYVHNGYKWARRNATFCLTPSGVRCQLYRLAAPTALLCENGHCAYIDVSPEQ